MDLAAPGVIIAERVSDIVRFRRHFQARNFGTKWTTGGTNNTWARRECFSATPASAT